jgi:hypothetical protein
MTLYANKIGIENFCTLSDYGNWVNLSKGSNSFNTWQIYRIRPDYQPPKPEPKIVKCEIVRDVYYGHDRLVGVYNNAFTYPAFALMVVPAFSHFEKSNGNKIGIENIATEIRNGGKVFACFVEE